MKIIKWGNEQKRKEPASNIKRFVCKNCGCIFEASKQEYDMYAYYNGPDQCKCPCCGMLVHTTLRERVETYL